MDMSRRGFLGGALATGGALTLAVTFGCGDKAAGRIRHANATGQLMANMYITVMPDGRIALTVNKTEIGQGVATGYATFEAEPPTWEQFYASRLVDHRLAALDAQGGVLGWTAAIAVSDRCVYAGVVEHSVYVDPDARGRGVGRLLLEALIASTEAAGIWTIQSGIFPENVASLRLHERAGFHVVATRRRVGRMALCRQRHE